MHRIWILGAVLFLVGGVGVTRFASFERRLDAFDEVRRTAPQRLLDLQRELERVTLEFESVRAELQALERQGAVTGGDVKSRLSSVEGDLGEVSRGLSKQRVALASIEATQSTLDSELEARVDQRVDLLEDDVSANWKSLQKSVAAAGLLSERMQLEVTRLHQDLSPDVDERWREIVAPTVQLAGEATVGSGVLLETQHGTTPGERESLVLTAWHVVRDIRADAGEEDAPIPVAIYVAENDVQHESAELLHYDADLDVALLRLPQPVRWAARLAPPARSISMRVFQGVYAVGCPLGNAPIPTRGEVAATTHEVDGNTYWMISAPTYIGNSGGGIYDQENHELIGIFSKIYTHGSLRPTVVPHMGLVTPIDQIYDWLEEQGYAHLISAPRDGDAGVALVLDAPGPQ